MKNKKGKNLIETFALSKLHFQNQINKSVEPNGKKLFLILGIYFEAIAALKRIMCPSQAEITENQIHMTVKNQYS